VIASQRRSGVVRMYISKTFYMGFSSLCLRLLSASARAQRTRFDEGGHATAGLSDCVA